MKTKQWLISSLFTTALLTVGFFGLGAEEIAIVGADRVNVRGQPTLIGEVITQLKKGETVRILEEITVAKPKPGEPVHWFRIQMPANTPVWVSALYIEATNKTVLPPKLNVRAGPGENFSVVGRITRGDTVKEIRIVDNWIEIETPPSAYGFIAAEFIEKAPVEAAATKPAASVAEPATPPPAVPPAGIAEKPAMEPPTPAVEPPPVKPQEEVLAPEPAVVEAAPAPAVEPAPSTATAVPKMVPPQNISLPPLVPPTAQAIDAPLRRKVIREGWVRTTLSIQAPTYYELVNPETRKTINYLHSPSTNLLVKPFRGQKIIATGEEFIDSRWTNTPVLEVETIELAPQ
jgi:uncharacterized protein YgiM (DUF1202 family)